MIISFAWTTPALIAGYKTCTRRDWSEVYLRTAQNAYTAGALVDAYDKSPRQHGQKVATIRLTELPAWSRDLPLRDYDAEGLKWLDDYGYTMNLGGRLGTGVEARPRDLWDAWMMRRPPAVVVRFEVVELTPLGAMAKKLLEMAGKDVR